MNNYEFKMVNKKDIVIPKWLPRKPSGDESLKDEDDRNLADSIDKSGQINPITLRINETGKYELIAGSRRFDAVKGDMVDAKIETDISAFDARMVCLAENYHRKDINVIERDNFIYETYIIGLECGKIKSKKDFAKGMSITLKTLSRYIAAGEDRLKNNDDEIIKNASTSVLDSTKHLRNNPSVRRTILEMEKNKILDMGDIPDISKSIKACLNEGITENMVMKVIELSKEIKIVTDDDNNSQVNITHFDLKKFENVTSSIIELHPDVRGFIVNQKVTLEDAKEINQFESKEARRQLVQEKMKLESMRSKSEDLYDGEWKKNMKIRKQQEIDIKTKGNTDLKTLFDIQHQRKLDFNIDKDDRHDDSYIKRYRGIKADIAGAYSHFHPKKCRTEDGKRIVTHLLKEIYTLTRLVLIDLGEIKGNDPIGPGFINVDAKLKNEETIT